VCAIHPSGVEGNRCPDFLLDPEVKELWSPIGFIFIDEQLFRKPITYQVDFELTRTRSQEWEILETHPFFTGVCPNCGESYPQKVKIIHYDCQSWLDG